MEPDEGTEVSGLMSDRNMFPVACLLPITPSGKAE